MIVGQQILNYRINYLIGEGGMGSVYLATHQQLGRKVAIKVLNPALARNQSIRERFRNEATALSQLQHPGIVTLYDYLEEEEALYLIMEYAEGLTLDEYIRTVSGPIPEDKAAALFAKVLDGFAYAHEQGVIHRDIKPSNIIITPDTNVKILDFGIAKIVNQSQKLTRTGTKMGTILYMSPEQVKGEPVDRRSDIYSLGITLFQMITGRSPYDEQNATEFAIYNKIVHEPLPRAREFYPGVSGRMQAILDKATAKTPAERFADCREFREALWSQSGPPLSRPATFRQATVLETPAEPTASSRETNDTQPPRKPRSMAGIGIVAGLGFILLTVALMLFWSPGNGPAPPESASSETGGTATDERPLYTPPAETSPRETTGAAPGSDTGVPGPVESVPVPELSNKAELISRYIQLEYEIPGSSPDERASANSRFPVLIVLSNTASNVQFENLTLKISYQDANGETIGNYLYEHGTLPAGRVERFIVERSVSRAVGVTCSIASADPVAIAPDAF